jgi:hypothetical protein
MIAVPNFEKNTELEFDYWIEPYEGPTFWSFRGEDAVGNMVLLCSLLTVIALVLTTGLWLIYRRFEK